MRGSVLPSALHATLALSPSRSENGATDGCLDSCYRRGRRGSDGRVDGSSRRRLVGRRRCRPQPPPRSATGTPRAARPRHAAEGDDDGRRRRAAVSGDAGWDVPAAAARPRARHAALTTEVGLRSLQEARGATTPRAQTHTPLAVATAPTLLSLTPPPPRNSDGGIRDRGGRGRHAPSARRHRRETTGTAQRPGRLVGSAPSPRMDAALHGPGRT